MSTRTPLETRLEPIAVIGMSCRLPGGASPTEFWEFLARGGDAVTETPPGRWDVEAYYDPNPDAPAKMYTNRGAYLEDVDRFSPTFFGISPREAQYMDPQQRLLLELHWEALENAGIAPPRLAQRQVGVFAGIGTTDYVDLQASQGPNICDPYSATGGAHSAAAGRLSYFLGVRGPSLAVDTACSSSLVSVHLGMVSLRSGESDLALASGVCLNIFPDVFVNLCKARMLSPDGLCKAFDAAANGYVRGEGAGVLVLKRLSDALADGDRIEAVLRGSATNHNGRSAGLTVPSGPAQQEVIRTALRNAGLSPADVSYVEAHGTGTAVGDPIEAAALGQVFAGRSTPLLIGSVKTNCGHLEWAAGVCGLVKTILSIQHGVIPPTLHLRNPNPMIPWDRIPLRVVTETTPWPEGKRIAGVSSFGFGGTNAHVVVEEAPKPLTPEPVPDRPVHMLTLSARSESALRKLAEQFGGAVSPMPPEDLGSICYTANTGRARFEHRLAVTTTNNRELAAELGGFATQVGSPRVRTGRAPSAPPAVCMLFTGQGSQFPGMGRELYQTEPRFRREIDRCATILSRLQQRDLHELLFGDGTEIHQTRYTQPALFSLEYALAQLWRSWGVEPEAVLGHSVGEYAAACVAGVFEPEDALTLLEARGRLMWALPSNGAMFAIQAPEDRVLPLLGGLAGRLSIAAVNAPTEIVISGERGAAESVVVRLREQGVVARELTVSHAFHSPLMEPMLDEFASVAATVTFRQPTLRLISNITGREVGDEILDPGYWVRHVREAVRFADSIRAAADIRCGIFLEVGPHPVLCGLGRQTLPAGDLAWLPSLHGKRGDWLQMLDSTGEMLVRGLDLDWESVEAEQHAAGRRRKIALPTYPFERERYWIPPVAGSARTGRGALRPLAESFAQSPLAEEKILSVTLGVDTHPYLSDHRVFGQVVAPGATYLALLCTAAELLGWPGCAMENIFFLSPLALPEREGRTLHAVLKPTEDDGDRYTVELAVLSTDDPSMEAARLMSGRISQIEGADPASVEIDRLRQRCLERIETDGLYESIREAGIELRDAFRWISEVWLGKGEALARLQLPETMGALDGYRVHPALVDAGFQVAAAVLDKERQHETLLPFSVARMRQTGAASGTTWWCHAVMTGHSTWDIRYYDVRGECLADIEGFEMREAPASTFLRRRVADWLYRVDWQPQPIKESSVVGPGTWLLLDNNSVEGAALQEFITGHGGHSVVVPEASGSRIAELLNSSDQSRGIIHMWGIAANGDSDPATRAQQLATGFLSVVHAALALPAPPPIWIATHGAQAVARGETVHPEQTVLWGMKRGLLVESPALRIICVDLDGEPDRAAALLAAELNAAPGESQIAWRGDTRSVARLVRCPDAAPASIEGPFRLQLKEYGSPDNLQLAPMKRKKPLRDQVEIAISATALNFRDVLISLGMLRQHYEGALGLMKASDIQLGFDCAGTVSAVGEGVTDLAVGDPVMSSCTGSAASYATTYRQGVIRIPKGMDMATASALPTVFWTAYHGLMQLAHLKRGERILIHAAAGGVGLAAIQLAQHVGAEIFATASPAKWDYLRSQGVTHIMSSRTLDFADEIMRLTGGEGVDVVLNSLAGAVLERTFSVLRRGGRFIEIGRLAEGIPDEAAHRPDVAYFCFDVGTVITRDYAASVKTGNELRELFEQGVLRPLPITTFAIDDAAEAFRFMQQSKHIGKIVLRTGDSSLVRADASYLITGGLSGIGLRVAGMLADEGARHLVLCGRSEPTPEATETIDSLRTRGVTVTVARGDVSKSADVTQMLEACRAVAPLRGIFHAAGVLREALIRNQTASHFDAAMAPKVRGAWELHKQTHGLPLDYFVCFSSMASLVGSAGQNNYCAANAFLDGLAALRRSEGLPALSVAWGPWAETGMAAALEFGGGIDKMSVQEGLDALRTLMRAQRVPAGSAGVMKIRWNVFAERFPNAEAQAWFSAVADSARRSGTKSDANFLSRFHAAREEDRQKLLDEHILDTLRRAMGLGAGGDIARTEGWSAVGVDSLMMVEIINRLESSLRLKLPVELMAREASIRSVSEFALAKLKEVSSPAGQSAEPDSHAVGPDDAADEGTLAMRMGFHEGIDAIPQILTTTTDQRRRQVLIDGRWRCDFASCNYLGFDLEPEIMAAIPAAVERWGTHPSWTRAVSSPAIYGELEQELARMLRVPDTLVFPSISLLHLGVLPTLAGYSGVILTDASAHHSMAEACMRAQAGGTEWLTFRHNDLADLESKLTRQPRSRPKIIATDGVYSMGSPAPPLAGYSRLAKEYNATVYVDDAHGFGIMGESPDEKMRYGYGGNGIVRHLGLDYEPDRIVYVAGLSKAFSSYAAFVTCQGDTKLLMQSSGTYVFSGPTCIASLATALAGLRLNQRDGDERRRRIHGLTTRLIEAARALEFEVDNAGDFPIVGVVMGEWDRMIGGCRTLWDHDILITPATFPAVPANRNLVRFSITSANTEEEVDQAVGALRAIRDAWPPMTAGAGSNRERWRA